MKFGLIDPGQCDRRFDEINERGGVHFSHDLPPMALYRDFRDAEHWRRLRCSVTVSRALWSHPQRQCRTVFDLFEGETRSNISDPADLRQILHDKPLQFLNVLDNDAD